MFTGIIEEVGTITELTTDPEGGHLRVKCSKLLPRFEASSSVAVNGCCLTVTRRDDTGFWFDLAPETLNRTGFRRLQVGAQVNLEAPLTMGTPLGGHIVQGHIDGTGTFLALPPAGDENYWLDVEIPEDLKRYLVEKGSVAVEGISLTVAAIEGTHLRIAIIPYTIEHTNLRTLKPGDPVNIEADVLAKYVEKLLQERAIPLQAPPAAAEDKGKTSEKLTVERLVEEGF
jgi:riboflavin synthase